MKILADLNRMAINGYRIEVCHEKEVIFFNFAVFNKNNFGEHNEVFRYINAYWEQQTPLFQQSVFNIYREVEEIFDDILNKDALTDRLKDAVKRLYAMHDFTSMREWVMYRSGMTLPANGFDKSYRHNPDKNTSEEKTYVQFEYWELITLCLMLRLMVPIWARYTKHIKNHSGNLLKELQAFKLLERTNVPNLPPVKKLLQYIRANLKKDAINIPVNFISEDDFPYWNMTLLCVRKLCIGDLQSKEDKATLVTLTHNFITAQSNYADGDFTNTIHTKNTEDFGGDENKISTMECFRINMDISIAEAEEIPFGLEFKQSVINKTCIDTPEDLLNTFILSAERMRGRPLMRPQQALMAMIMKNVISPLGLNYLEEDQKLWAMGVTAAALWHRGFKYLGLLATSVTELSGEHRASIGPVKERVPPELQKELREVFPHVRIIQNRKLDPKEDCRVTNDIEMIVDDVFNFHWQPTAPLPLLREVFGPNASETRLTAAPDLRIQLTKLAIAVAQNKIARG